jgi:hypothetical protein
MNNYLKKAERTSSLQLITPAIATILRRRERIGLLILLLLINLLCACSLKQINSTVRDHSVSLGSEDLSAHGIGFITPSTVTGQEEDKHSLALIFADAVRSKRPEIRCVRLSEVLGSINRNGLAEEYKQMFEDYRYTSIFKRKTLRKLGEVTGVRYLAQIKLANFTQKSQGRLSVLGLRIAQTKESNIRLFLSIWDSWDGSIAWEGIQEINYAYDTIREKPISFKQSVDEAAKELINRLP